jgi:F-type H+-transporting ATPase subunit delta
MASLASARRYARALFEVVTKSGDPMQAVAEVNLVAEAFASHADLRRAMTGVGVPLSVKTGIMRELLALQPVSPVVSRLFFLMVENDDLNEVADMAADFERRVLDLHHIVRIDVTTAVPLGAERARALEQALAQVTGGRVRLDAKVDPDVIGGVVAQVGSRVFDGSLARHLERVRERLAARRS